MVWMSRRTTQGRGGEAWESRVPNAKLRFHLTVSRSRVAEGHVYVYSLASACDGVGQSRSRRLLVFCVRGTLSSPLFFSSRLSSPRRVGHSSTIFHASRRCTSSCTSTAACPRTHNISFCGWSWGTGAVRSAVDSRSRLSSHRLPRLPAVGNSSCASAHEGCSICCGGGCDSRQPPTHAG